MGMKIDYGRFWKDVTVMSDVMGEEEKVSPPFQKKGKHRLHNFPAIFRLAILKKSLVAQGIARELCKGWSYHQ